jgi:hypothetical protein
VIKFTPVTRSVVERIDIQLSVDDATHLSFALAAYEEYRRKDPSYVGSVSKQYLPWMWLNHFRANLHKARNGEEVEA